MKTIKIVTLAILAAVTTSCQFDLRLGQENGNGNVVTEDRPVSENFDKVRGSAGLDVFLTKGNENKITVEADENLLDNIETEVRNGKLYITTNENIGRSKSKKIYVTYESLISVEASSGADVIGNSVLKSEYITLDSSSGADLEIEVNAREVRAESSSGADLKVSGTAIKLIADASSGSDIKAKDLIVTNCNADASSGADITVNVKGKIEADASSGGDVKYYGNPEAVRTRDGVSGSVRKM